MGKRTPLYEEHRKLGAVMVDFGGWDMPVYYSTLIDEHNTTRNAACLFDICHMGEIAVEGPRSLELLEKALPRNISGLGEGRMCLSVMCNERGGILDDLTVYRFANERYMLVVNASNIEKDFNWLEKINGENGFGAVLRNASDETAKLDFQGPCSQEVLQQIACLELAEIGFYCFKEGKLDGIDAVVSRSGYTGEDGFELYFPAGNAVQLWRRILKAGKEAGVKPAGLGARDTLRLECAMNLYGHEMDESRTPLQARYGWTVDLGKDFIGKEALVEERQNGASEVLAGFELLERAIPRQGYRLLKNNEAVGTVTSGTLSPTLKKGIGLCYIRNEFSVPGTEIVVEIRGREYRAKMVELPFYRPAYKKQEVS